MINYEQRGMRFSLIGACVFAVLGLSFAFLTGSQAVLLDGAFNLISAIMALFAMKVQRLLKEPFSERMPAGYVALEPFYVFTKGLITMVLTLFVIASNIVIMLKGGSELQLGVIIIYIGLAIVGNFIIYFLIDHHQKKANSPMLTVEKENWLVNALISSGIGLSFLLVLLFQDGFLKPFVQYVDQIIVIAVGLLTIGVPIQAIRGGLAELLLMGPDAAIREKAEQIIGRIIADQGLSAWRTYVLKTGRKFWITLIVRPEEDKISTAFPDQLKEMLGPALEKEFKEYNLDVMITKQD